LLGYFDFGVYEEERVCEMLTQNEEDGFKMRKVSIWKMVGNRSENKNRQKGTE